MRVPCFRLVSNLGAGAAPSSAARTRSGMTVPRMQDNVDQAAESAATTSSSGWTLPGSREVC
jgi:hypothetical protein